MNTFCTVALSQIIVLELRVFLKFVCCCFCFVLFLVKGLIRLLVGKCEILLVELLFLSNFTDDILLLRVDMSSLLTLGTVFYTQFALLTPGALFSSWISSLTDRVHILSDPSSVPSEIQGPWILLKWMLEDLLLRNMSMSYNSFQQTLEQIGKKKDIYSGK